jgi:hypothetical protein
MEALQLRQPDAAILGQLKSRPHLVNTIAVKDQEEKVKLLIIRDLLRLNWTIHREGDDGILIAPPEYYNKETIRRSMAVNRSERLETDKAWIDKHTGLARKNLATGAEAFLSEIRPVIEVCSTQRQHNLFRIFRYYWSSPYSDYVGRRIKLLIRDDALPNRPIIGIAALGSPIIHIPERDHWIGWDKQQRTDKLIYTMDAYVLGAVPPYGELLGGKLISYMLASNEVREIYRQKYKDVITLIQKRQASELVGIFTTSLYGKSAQYGRIKYRDKLLYIPTGATKGFGSLHLTQETFSEMVKLLQVKGVAINNKFGDGPSWRMRVIRAVGDILGFDADILLNHSFRRQIYTVPLIENFKEFLTAQDDTPKHFDYPLEELVSFWKYRWLKQRKQNKEVASRVLDFEPSNFEIT